MTELYDFEFAISVRGTGVFLHQRRQDPCENALRLKREDLDKTPTLHLHGAKAATVEYRRLTDATDLDDPKSWTRAELKDKIFRLELRKTGTLSAELCLQAGKWPDGTTTENAGVDAALA
jgi:hypothetical protein